MNAHRTRPSLPLATMTDRFMHPGEARELLPASRCDQLTVVNAGCARFRSGALKDQINPPTLAFARPLKPHPWNRYIYSRP